ncbi:MAG: sensor histidine kinase [Myxococcales bacterium]|nr:sensor histidine kinase [Myxococcales bacterium]
MTLERTSSHGGESGAADPSITSARERRPMVLVLDAELRLVTWSPAAARLVGDEPGPGRTLDEVHGGPHPLTPLLKMAQTGALNGQIELDGVGLTYSAQLCADRYLVLTLGNDPVQQLRVALDDKTRLLQELHHRARNHLHLAVSLVRLWQPPSAELRDFEARIAAMSTVHEILRPSSAGSRLDLAGYLGRLVEQVTCFARFDPPSEVTMELEPALEVDAEVASRLGMVVSQLCADALVAGRPVRLHTQARDGGVLVEVHVEGGLPPSWAPGSEAILLGQGLCHQVGGTLGVFGDGAPDQARLFVPG